MSDCILYKIAGWEDHYEKSQSKRAKNHHWVAMPIKHDGGGFRRITIQPNATDLFAAWCLIVQVGAKCKIRGVLADSDGVPLDAEDLAIKTGFPVSVFEAAFEFFSSPKINWLLCSDIANTPIKTETAPSESDFSASEKQHMTVHDKTEQTIPCNMPCSTGFNDSIIHRPENSVKIELNEYEDFCKYDITSIFCEICGEKTGPAIGFLSKLLKEASVKFESDAKACNIFRNILFEFWSELKTGEEPKSRAAALTSRIKKKIR